MIDERGLGAVWVAKFCCRTAAACYFVYRYHSCGGFLQNIDANFVETDEFVTRCEELLQLVQRLVENETKVCYNNFTGMIVRR